MITVQAAPIAAMRAFLLTRDRVMDLELGPDNCGGGRVNLDRLPKTIAGDWCGGLVPGGPYFTVSYHESDVNLPKIVTLVYLGVAGIREDDGQPTEGFLFQDAESYQLDGDWSELPEGRSTELAADSAVMFYDKNSVGSIADIDGLLVLLSGLRERMRCGFGWSRALPEEK